VKDAEAAARQTAEAAAADQIPASVDIPPGCGEHSPNRTTVCALTLDTGFGVDQFTCLELLRDNESDRNEPAEHPIGAHGVPQSRPGRARSGAGGDRRTDPVTQVTRGLGDLEVMNRSPCDARLKSETEGRY
jgi:hypothetical protein